MNYFDQFILWLGDFQQYLINLDDNTKFIAIVCVILIALILRVLAQKQLINKLKPFVYQASNMFTEKQEDKFIEYIVKFGYVALPKYIKTFYSEEKVIKHALELWNNIEEWSQE